MWSHHFQLATHLYSPQWLPRSYTITNTLVGIVNQAMMQVEVSCFGSTVCRLAAILSNMRETNTV